MSARSRMTILTSLATVVLLAGAPAAWAQSFTGTGDLPGGGIFSRPGGLSADGLVVVGQTSGPGGDQAFRWTAAGGLVGLGDLPGGALFSSAADLSADGSVIVGVASVPGDAGGFANMAFRWTAAGGMVALGDLPGGLAASTATGVSDDGSVVVGIGSNASGFFENEAFRWTAAGGMAGLGFLPGAMSSGAFDVSADGSTVVGKSPGPFGNGQAFRWTAATGMVAVGFLPGDNVSQASGASADGSVVVGTSNGPDNVLEAFRWTAATGMVGLGSIPGGFPFRSQGVAVSADGSIVVGGSNGPNGPDEAFIWDATNGMRSLTNVLVNDFGLNLTGWSLSFAMGVSDDGLVITGSGTNPQGAGEGWVADLRPPPLCTPADVNNDGAVDGRDIASFVSVLINQNGTPQQVCAGDVQPMPNGSVGLEDVPSFVACVLAGGC